MRQIFIYLFIAPIIFSCASVELKNNIVFDYEQFPKITFLSNSVDIRKEYVTSYQEPFVDHLLDISPSERVFEWTTNNIKGFGLERKLVITIKEASITSFEFKNEEKIAGIINKPNEIKYDLKYEIDFNIYDDNDSIIANTIVKATRSITSSTLISLHEREQILDELVYKTLNDLALKSQQLTRRYLGEYIL